MLKKYEDILNEKKDMQAEKSGVEAKITSLFREKPSIKGGDKWSDSKGIYSLANIKKYVGGDNQKVDQVFSDMQKDKKIKSIRVKNLAFNETYPYYYNEDFTSKEEAEKYKASMEKNQKPAEKHVAPKEEEKPKVVRKKAAAKPTAVKPTKKAPT
jgi:hypothetical protein